MLALNKIQEISIKNPGKAALITDDIVFSWRDYKNVVKNNVHKLLANKIINEDTTRAIVISENKWELFILYSCLVTSKIAYSGIDYTMNDTKKIAAISRSNANLVFYSENNKPSNKILDIFSEKVNFVPITAISLDVSDDDFDYSLAIAELNHQDNITSFAFTSGTTGLPKCIYRTSSFDEKRLAIFTEMYNFNEKDIFMVTMPFYHVSVNGWAKLTLVNGGTVVFSDFSSNQDLYYKLTNYNITSMLITPHVLNRLIRKLNENNFNNKTVRFIMVGGKNFPTILKAKAIATFGPVLNEYYGSSETGINTLANSIDMEHYPASSGKFMEGSKLLILDKNHNILPANKIGRIAINSFQNAAGYINKEMEEFHHNNERYILTSDYGYLSEDGYIFVTQRVIYDDKKVENNIYSLENSIRMLSGVKDLVIVQNRNNQYSIYLSFEESTTNILKNNILEAIDLLLTSVDTKISIHAVSDINYSLSGKVKYNEFLNASEGE